MSKLITKKYKNNNPQSTAYGKTYGRILHTETLTTNEFANHISSHGSPFDRATILGVITAACDCLVELALDSKKVRLGDLGTFYMSAESTGEADAGDFSDDNIKKVHLRFMPNKSQSYPLDSVTMRKKASFLDLAQMGKSSLTDSESADGDSDNDDEPTGDRP